MNHILLISSGSFIYDGECFSGVYGWQNHVTGKWDVGESMIAASRTGSKLIDGRFVHP